MKKMYTYFWTHPKSWKDDAQKVGATCKKGTFEHGELDVIYHEPPVGVAVQGRRVTLRYAVTLYPYPYPYPLPLLLRNKVPLKHSNQAIYQTHKLSNVASNCQLQRFERRHFESLAYFGQMTCLRLDSVCCCHRATQRSIGNPNMCHTVPTCKNCNTSETMVRDCINSLNRGYWQRESVRKRCLRTELEPLKIVPIFGTALTV